VILPARCPDLEARLSGGSACPGREQIHIGAIDSEMPRKRTLGPNVNCSGEEANPEVIGANHQTTITTRPT
jgi:hypothetical protein